jgi:hypothetical protein
MLWDKIGFGKQEKMLPEDTSVFAWCTHCGQKNRVPASAHEAKKSFRCGKCGQPIAVGIDCLIICDVSPSMIEPAGETTRIAKLKYYLGKVIDGLESQRAFYRVLAFSGTASEVADLASLPDPAGGSGTNFQAALKQARRYCPSRIILISDGEPDARDGERAALTEAAQLQSEINTIFCGNPNNRRAIDFLSRLARENAGRFEKVDFNSDAAHQIERTFGKFLLPPAGSD